MSHFIQIPLLIKKVPLNPLVALLLSFQPYNYNKIMEDYHFLFIFTKFYLFNLIFPWIDNKFILKKI